jgi:hypothetical protein
MLPEPRRTVQPALSLLCLHSKPLPPPLPWTDHHSTVTMLPLYCRSMNKPCLVLLCNCCWHATWHKHTAPCCPASLTDQHTSHPRTTLPCLCALAHCNRTYWKSPKHKAATHSPLQRVLPHATSTPCDKANRLEWPCLRYKGQDKLHTCHNATKQADTRRRQPQKNHCSQLPHAAAPPPTGKTSTSQMQQQREPPERCRHCCRY